MAELAGVPEIVTDPIGVIVDLITGIDPGLDRLETEAVVAVVAGGRARRRKLAQALAQRPAILTGGRPPAPLAAGNLLIALRKAGSTAIAAPLCAGCGKSLRLRCPKLSGQGSNRILIRKGTGSSARKSEKIHS